MADCHWQQVTQPLAPITELAGDDGGQPYWGWGGPGSSAVTHPGDGHQGWGDHGGSKFKFNEELSSSKSLLGPCGVPILHEPEYQPQLPESSEDLSGSALLREDRMVVLGSPQQSSARWAWVKRRECCLRRGKESRREKLISWKKWTLMEFIDWSKPAPVLASHASPWCMEIWNNYLFW